MRRAAVTILLAALCAAGGVWYGRSSAPARVATAATATAAAAASASAHAEERRTEAPTRTVVRRIVRPCPAPAAAPAEQVVEETVVERGPVVIERVEDATSNTTASAASSTTKVVTAQPRFMLGAKAGVNLSFRPQYGAEGKYRLAGPLWVGAEAGTYGGFVTLSFTF